MKYERVVIPVGKGVHSSMGIVSWLDTLNERLSEGWEVERVDEITTAHLDKVHTSQLYLLKREVTDASR